MFQVQGHSPYGVVSFNMKRIHLDVDFEFVCPRCSSITGRTGQDFICYPSPNKKIFVYCKSCEFEEAGLELLDISDDGVCSLKKIDECGFKIFKIEYEKVRKEL